MSSQEIVNGVRFNADGLVPAIAQEAGSSRVLMMAWMNADAIHETQASGYACYYSRSRQSLWRKGEQSGNRQRVVSMHLDCDGDTLLLQVEQSGGIACHTGRHSCFFRRWESGTWQETEAVVTDPADLYGSNTTSTPVDRPIYAPPPDPGTVLAALARTLEERKSDDPSQSYVASLYAKGLDGILKKVGEEATETIVAAKNGQPDQLVYETADLWFHTLVMLADQGLGPDDVLLELTRRTGTSGIVEKNSRTDDNPS